MYIVINIPKDTYKNIIESQYTEHGFIFDEDKEVAIHEIKNGTPLPKGHGKLIAEPTEEDIAKTIGGQNDFAECIREAVKAVFDNAPTIIEADTEESEG